MWRLGDGHCEVEYLQAPEQHAPLPGRPGHARTHHTAQILPAGRVDGVEWPHSGRSVDVQWTLQWASGKWGFSTVGVHNFGRKDVDIPESDLTSTVKQAQFLNVHCNVHCAPTVSLMHGQSYVTLEARCMSHDA